MYWTEPSWLRYAVAWGWYLKLAYQMDSTPYCVVYINGPLFPSFDVEAYWYKIYLVKKYYFQRLACLCISSPVCFDMTWRLLITLHLTAALKSCDLSCNPRSGSRCVCPSHNWGKNVFSRLMEMSARGLQNKINWHSNPLVYCNVKKCFHMTQIQRYTGLCEKINFSLYFEWYVHLIWWAETIYILLEPFSDHRLISSRGSDITGLGFYPGPCIFICLST